MSSSIAGGALLDLGQRQIGHNPRTALATLDQDLVGLAKHLLHGFQEDAFAGHVLGVPVLLVDRDEAGRLALRIGDHTGLVALGILDQLRRLAFGHAALLVAVLLGLVDELLLVLPGAHHFGEGIGHLAWRLHVAQVDLRDGDCRHCIR